MKRQWQLGLSLTLLGGIGMAGPVLAAEAEPRPEQARQTVKALMDELSGELEAAMASGGPAEAIDVCVERAPEITARLSREKGWRVTRVSDQVRDPLLGMPDAWEQRTLAQFRARHSEGESLKGMSRGEVVTEPNGDYYRYMQAIPMQKVCTNCHGTEDELAPAARETLAERYPHDEGTGYEVGDLRGAFSIKQPLE